MKRFIKSSVDVKASLVPAEYTKLAIALREASKAIDQYVDKNLEGYIYWDEVQKYLRSGMEAISKAGHDIEENHVEHDYIDESTDPKKGRYIKSSLDDNLPKFVKVNDDFVELDPSGWFKCLRVTTQEYYEMPEDVRDLLDEYALVRGSDSDSCIFIAVDGDNMRSVNDEDYEILKSAGISADNNDLETVMIQEYYV